MLIETKKSRVIAKKTDFIKKKSLTKGDIVDKKNHPIQEKENIVWLLRGCFNHKNFDSWLRWGSIMGNSNFNRISEKYNLDELFVTRLDDFDSFAEAMMEAFSVAQIQQIINKYNGKKCTYNKIEHKRIERETQARNKEEKKEQAILDTTEAQDVVNQLEVILLYSLNVANVINWNSLLDNKKYPVEPPVELEYISIPVEPTREDVKYLTSHSFYGFICDKIFSKSKNRKEDKANEKFKRDYNNWEKDKLEIEQKNKSIKNSYLKSLNDWEIHKHKYEEKQTEFNNSILKKKNLYLNLESNTISEYCGMILTNSKYPDYFPKEWDIDYQKDSKILIINYSLPNIDCLPTLKAIKYIASKDEFNKTHLSDIALNKLYDGLLYQIALRVIYELYAADVANALDSIVFNGWVDSIDKATGLNVNSCIMSLQASKDEFLAINLEKVDPKACFKQLKGVGSSKLHGLAPVAPIVNIDKEDSRFVAAYDVVDGMNESDNLAAMEWQDFENLIREIFQKEFAKHGGEVKITQASRDGGVDAIAFDPDPIRGGKIVIQAKRYTNVVGVSAVRDLYGTTMNEGAIKGILVTTANYGPDAYKFAKGKPLTLLNGGNLLHLLEKHGHRAKIDLGEAKVLLAE